MRAVLQRVEKAAVSVEGATVGSIGPGLMVLLGVEEGDSAKDIEFLRRKILNLRIFSDSKGKLDRSLLDVKGAVLLVSQFTLLGECRKGSRPSYSRAAPPHQAEELYRELIRQLSLEGVPVESGRFQAMMKVSLVNDGPVTFVLDSRA